MWSRHRTRWCSRSILCWQPDTCVGQPSVAAMQPSCPSVAGLMHMLALTARPVCARAAYLHQTPETLRSPLQRAPHYRWAMVPYTIGHMTPGLLMVRLHSWLVCFDPTFVSGRGGNGQVARDQFQKSRVESEVMRLTITGFPLTLASCQAAS